MRGCTTALLEMLNAVKGCNAIYQLKKKNVNITNVLLYKSLGFCTNTENVHP